MTHKLATTILLLMALFLASTVVASTTWYVNGVSGNNSNDCKTPTTACKTIGHAISLASSGDSIRVAAATYTENLTIGFSLNIIGSGARTTIIDGGGVGRVVTISSATAHVALSGVTIRDGRAKETGGGILNSGILRVIASTISGNTAFNVCTNSCFSSGGGITNSTGATLTISKSTVSGNHAPPPCNVFLHHCSSTGGGILNQGSLTVNNSTISGNIAFIAGGIGNVVNSILSVNNSTIAGNDAGVGGGIYNFAATKLQNSIVADNLGGNCTGTMTSNGYNLSSDSTCNFNGPGDLNNTDPMLGPFQNNGGPTDTISLSSGSPAVDAGNPSGCTDGLGHLLKTDQRGKPRPDTEDTGGCDIGAFERQSD